MSIFASDSPDDSGETHATGMDARRMSRRGRDAAESRRTSQAATIEPMLGIRELADILACSRRAIERLRASGQFPRPDINVGRMPRWKPETIRKWIDQQADGRGGRR